MAGRGGACTGTLTVDITPTTARCRHADAPTVRRKVALRSFTSIVFPAVPRPHWRGGQRPDDPGRALYATGLIGQDGARHSTADGSRESDPAAPAPNSRTGDELRNSATARSTVSATANACRAAGLMNRCS